MFEGIANLQLHRELHETEKIFIDNCLTKIKVNGLNILNSEYHCYQNETYEDAVSDAIEMEYGY